MKKILFSFLMLLGLQAFSQHTPKKIRYFMQAAPSPANTIPYGTNPKAGHYIKSGDAKIYYELYGKGKPLVILHGGNSGLYI